MKRDLHGWIWNWDPLKSLFTPWFAPNSLCLPPKFTSNPVVAHSVKIWTQIRKSLGLHRTSDLSPIVNNHLFLPSCTDLTFRTRFDKGITNLRTVITMGLLCPFLSSRINLICLNPICIVFFQIRHFVQNQNPKFLSRPPETLVDSCPGTKAANF